MLKTKVCADKDCDSEFTQYKTTDKYCSYQCKNKNKNQKSGIRKSFKPVSDKRLEELSIYRPLRDKYLSEHPVCEVKDCNRQTTNLHHKNGRRGKMLYNTDYFFAACSECHPKRIHENPKWARENGYLI